MDDSFRNIVLVKKRVNKLILKETLIDAVLEKAFIERLGELGQ